MQATADMVNSLTANRYREISAEELIEALKNCQASAPHLPLLRRLEETIGNLSKLTLPIGLCSSFVISGLAAALSIGVFSDSTSNLLLIGRGVIVLTIALFSGLKLSLFIQHKLEALQNKLQQIQTPGYAFEKAMKRARRTRPQAA